jgi:hypothetical protein
VAGGNPGDAADQLKALIKSLHQAGIEVLLEVREAALAVPTSGPGGQTAPPAAPNHCPGVQRNASDLVHNVS